MDLCTIKQIHQRYYNTTTVNLNSKNNSKGDTVKFQNQGKKTVKCYMHSESNMLQIIYAKNEQITAIQLL